MTWPEARQKPGGEDPGLNIFPIFDFRGKPFKPRMEFALAVLPGAPGEQVGRTEQRGAKKR